MSRFKGKKWNAFLIIMPFIIIKTSAQTEQLSNIYDEYEVIDTQITQDLKQESWDLSSENVRGVEFQILELYTDSTKVVEPENETVYKGRVFLEDRKGVIYSIVDPIGIDPRLNILADQYILVDSRGKIKKPVIFYPYTNYEKNIKKYEVLIYKGNDLARRNPIAKITGDKIDYNLPIVWDGEMKSGFDLRDQSDLFYILRVYDKSGAFDETVAKRLTLTDMPMDDLSEKSEVLKKKVYGTTNLAIQDIPIAGSKVKFYGRDLSGNTLVKIDGQNIEVSPSGDFIYETISDQPLKIYNFKIETDGDVLEYPIEIELTQKYQYLVALADFFYDRNKVSGSNAIIKNDPSFRPSYYTTGRLAFYYKGIKDKYRITAQADTWGQEIKYLFSDFYKRDTDALFRRIDRRYWPFDYGDESELYYDVETEGKAYLRVDWDKSQALWGNYETGLDNGVYNNYNRSLYGARTEYNSLKLNSFGESKNHLKVFASSPDTSYKRDMFLGTGGSIYNLSERDVVIGSPKLTLELKDKQTGRVVNRVPLTQGTDYTINELAGRIILTNPLSQNYFDNTLTNIVKKSPSGETNVYLVVDYEYYSSENNISDLTAGVRGKSWITNSLAVGGTYVKENRKGELTDYELKSTDLTLRKSNQTYLKAEYSETDGNQLTKDSNWFSYNGGYDFIQQPIIKNNGKGEAYYLEGSFSPSDYSKKFSFDDNILVWYSKKDKNFSTASETSGVEKEELGLRILYNIDEKTRVFGETTKYKESQYDNFGLINGYQEQQTAAIGISKEFTEKLSIGLESKYIKNEEDESELITYNSNNLDNGEAIILGARMDYKFSEKLDGFGKIQSSVWRDKDYAPNNMLTLGAKYTPHEKLQLDGAVSTGNRGDAIDARVTYKYSSNYEIYTGYTFENDNDLSRDLTFGQRFKYNEGVSLFQENSIMKNYSEEGLLQGYGVEYEYQKDIFLGVLYQRGDVDIEDGKVTRNAISSSLRYENEKFNSRHKIEYGKDSGARSLSKWGLINNAKWKPTSEYTLFGEANYISLNGDSYTLKRDGEYLSRSFDGSDKYYELGLGFGYRPVFNDRLNIISRWNYIYDTNGTGLIDSLTSYYSRAHIFSVEAIYDLTQRMNIAGKYAIRDDRVKMSTGGDWAINTINLYSARLTYEIIYKWDIYLEYHILESKKTNEVLQGALVGIYRDITENMQVGIGYNFSKFDDNLKDIRYKNNGEDLDYTKRTWFINLIGKF